MTEIKTTMTPEEKFDAIANLKEKLEDNFVALGELLSEIKRMRLYRFRGYDNFKDFVEAEYQLSGSLAGKLASTFDLFIEDMDIDEMSVKEIGFERLQLIKPMIQKADWEVREEWIKKASDTPQMSSAKRSRRFANKRKKRIWT